MKKRQGKGGGSGEQMFHYKYTCEGTPHSGVLMGAQFLCQHNQKLTIKTKKVS